MPQGRFFNVSNADEINALQDELQPGDCLLMAPGEWMDPKIRLEANGTEEAGFKIYLMPQVFGQTVWRGRVELFIDGSHLELRGIWLDGTSENKAYPINYATWTTDVRFTNSAITGFDRAEGDEAGKIVWLRIWGSYHIVDWCEFFDKGTRGELLQVRAGPDEYPPDASPESYGHTITRNWFGPRPRTSDGEDGEGIQLGLKQSDFMDYNCTVEFNLFEDFDGEIECISVKSSNNIVRYNTFRRSACTITLRHTNRTLVEENYFFCDGKYFCGGLRMNGWTHVVRNNYIEEQNMDDGTIAGAVMYAGLSTDDYRDMNGNSTIENNLMVNCSRCIVAGWVARVGGDQPPVDIRYIGNIMTSRNETDYVFQEIEPGQENPFWQNNVGWGGIIDKEDEYEYGLRREDPQLEYDPEFQMYRPTAEGMEFDMTYPPLQKEEVGTTWM